MVAARLDHKKASILIGVFVLLSLAVLFSGWQPINFYRSTAALRLPKRLGQIERAQERTPAVVAKRSEAEKKAPPQQPRAEAPSPQARALREAFRQHGYDLNNAKSFAKNPPSDETLEKVIQTYAEMVKDLYGAK